jgi:hypothetical protein
MPDLLPAALLVLLPVGMVVAFRRSEHASQRRQAECYRLDFPRDTEAAAVVAALAGLSGLGAPGLSGGPVAALEAVADGEGIRHYLIVSHPVAAFAVSQLRAALPSLRLTADDGHRLTRPRLARELRSTSRRRALRTDRPAAVSASVLATLSPLADGERIVVQWLVAPAVPRRPVPRATRLPRTHHPVGPWLDPFWLDSAEDRRALADKQVEPLFLTVGRIGVQAGTPGRARALLRRVTAAFAAAANPGVRLVPRLRPSGVVARHLEGRSVPWLLPWPVLVNAAELAGVCGWPVGSPVLPGLRLGGCRQLPPAPEVPSVGTVLARSTYSGIEQDIAIGATERRQHLYCLGPTGCGKSTALANIAAQDARGDGALVVFDTKADLLEAVLARIPEHRRNDVVVLDPADTDRPVGFNLIGGSVADRELLVENVVSIFRNLFDGGAGGTLGPRSEDVLRAVLLTLTLHPGTTLTEAPRLISDERFRAWFLARIDEPVALGRFWQWAAGTSRGEWAAATAPLSNKLRAFLGRERIRLVLGQADGLLDFDEVLAEGRILLVSLAKGLLGESAANLFGALVMARLWQAVLRRASLAPERRRPVSVVLDEFSDYTGMATPLPDLLAQGRGLGASVVLAHQAVHQVPSEIRHAALANCRSKLVWQLSADDARILAREFHPHLSADDLQGLGPYEVAALVATGGSVAPPLTGVTLPLSPAVSDPARLRALSRERWGRPRHEVEAAIRHRQGDQPNPAPVGRTRRRR